MKAQKRLAKRRQDRAYRVRKRVRGTAERPRLSVHRTALHVWLQLIDDEAGRTLCATSTKALDLPKTANVAAAKSVGEDLARKALALGVKAVCFDRGAFQYHGRVKAVADAVRAAGISV
ncbi:MAG: 50S ribosomal protein L18 [Planctomycetes bacterium]|nr:50S ribosomal protein L18 [Planctomycetota bacterium]